MLYLIDCSPLLPGHGVQMRRPRRGFGMQMSENVVIGLDGGGSKSRATIVSLNEPNLVLSRVKGGPSNW